MIGCCLFGTDVRLTYIYIILDLEIIWVPLNRKNKHCMSQLMIGVEVKVAGESDDVFRVAYKKSINFI